MDALAALRLQMEWGADEALADEPVDRRQDRARTVAGPAAASAPAPAAQQAAAPRMAATVEDLQAELAAFEGCALRRTAKSLVFRDGDPQSGLVLIGEAPSDDDDREGRPFSGAGGAALDRVFASAGLDRTSMLLTMLVPWRPPGNRPASAAEIQACLPFLLRHLALVQPRRVVLFGSAVARALGLGNEPPSRLRGAWRALPLVDVAHLQAMVMRPVEAALRTPAAKRDLWDDLLRLRAALNSDSQADQPAKTK